MFLLQCAVPLPISTQSTHAHLLFHQVLSHHTHLTPFFSLMQVLPHAAYYKRRGYPLKKIIPWAAQRGFTDALVVHEDRKIVNDLLLVHLPGGPTAHFKLTNLKLNKEIKVQLGGIVQ